MVGISRSFRHRIADPGTLRSVLTRGGIVRWDVDRLGMIASTVCAVHCAISPFIFLALPWWSFHEGTLERLEPVLITLAVVLAIIALTIGYRRHRDESVVLLFIIGFTLIGLGHLVIGTWSAMGEIALVTLGAGSLIAGHFRNQRLCRCVACPACALHAETTSCTHRCDQPSREGA